MSVKELLVDSWTNMWKNNFIPNALLVCLATFLIYLALGIVCGIAFAIHYVLGIIVVIAEIIIGYPIIISTTKVLWDTFQGKEVRVYSFIDYGFHNIKKMWAILGRKILKMLLLYILIIVLTVFMIGQLIYIFVSNIDTYNSAAELRLDNLYTSNEYNVNSVVSDTDYDIDLNEFYYDGVQSGSLVSVPEENMSSLGNDVSEALDKLVPELSNNIGSFVVILILFVVAYVLFIIKDLLYTYSYICAFDDESLTALESVERSEDLMTGKRAKYFWTLFLIAIIFELIVGILGEVSDSLIIAIINLVITIIYALYITSYSFTFFNKINTINTKNDIVSEEEPTPTEE